MKHQHWILWILLAMAGWAQADEEVIIHNGEDVTYYEYRVNGEVTEIVVKPKRGPEYKLVPTTDGSGDFVRSDNPEMRIPQWTILRW